MRAMNLMKDWWRTARQRRKAAHGRAAGAERAFIYARSAAVPADTDEQLRACRAYAAQRGMTIVGEVIDAPASGMADERPGYAALIAAVANGGINAVLVTDLSRISRSPATLDYFLKVAAKSSVRVIEVSAGVVQRIFRDYAAGESLEDIARSLNREGVPAPRCRRAS